MFIIAPSIFAQAVEGYRRAKTASKHDREGGRSDALASIVFSVVALEGFLNEAAELAVDAFEPPNIEPSTSATSFAALLSEAERGKASLSLKFQLAHQALTGSTYDVSRLPFQDFTLLVDLRNALIHYRSMDTWTQQPGELPKFNPAKLLNRLRAKNITATVDDQRAAASWLAMVSTVETARWSCETAASMVLSILDVIPRSHFHDCMNFMYRQPFTDPLEGI